MVYAEDDADVRRVITDEVQRNLLTLEARSPSLKIGAGSIVSFSVSGIIKDTHTYDLFINAAVSVLKKLT